MKIHVLGYWGTYPSAGEATTGFLVETENEKVLLDCGSGVLAQLWKVCSVEDLSAVVVTHHHHDHTADLGVLGYAVLLARLAGTRTAKLPMYMLEGPSHLMQDLRGEPLIDVNLIDRNSKVNIGELALSFAPTVHPVDCLAVKFSYRGKSFVFSADSSVCDELREIATGADLFLCEASMYDGQEDNAKQAGHLTARQAGALAREADVKSLALTHYPHYGNLDDLVSQASEAFGKQAIRIRTLDVLTV
ncbi:MBL fold metallo-hydrolase [Alicyclobacillus pomorum]|jgi:ribonuclease BN (tRNA processing enzyme)|uniref:MBL fold metallo-hydrolase n=1 Tax=Alicyclobacillus pomorum TaxID=204470 RepID=UPI000426AB02|nr:MBL fold metallo-hydrolase [Alicyclobacillus pomorum]